MTNNTKLKNYQKKNKVFSNINSYFTELVITASILVPILLPPIYFILPASAFIIASSSFIAARHYRKKEDQIKQQLILPDNENLHKKSNTITLEQYNKSPYSPKMVALLEKQRGQSNSISHTI